MSRLHGYIRIKYVTGIPFAHQGLQKPHSVVRYPVHTHISVLKNCLRDVMDVLKISENLVFFSSNFDIIEIHNYPPNHAFRDFGARNLEKNVKSE